MRISPTPSRLSIQFNGTKLATTKHLAQFLAAIAFCGVAAAQTAGTYQVTNVISDGSVPATTMDSNFINPWAITPTSTFWMNTQGSGFSYVVPTAGTVSFKVSIPSASGVTTTIGSPTGAVSAASAATGYILSNGTKASFIFDSLDGLISGWNSKLGATVSPIPVALPIVNNSSIGAVYTGLAQDTTGGSTFLYAANSTGNIHVFNSSWTDVTGTATFAGKFVDPNSVAGFVPFNIQTVGSNLDVTYAHLGPGGTPLPGGYVDEFDANGNFIKRIATGGPLSAPWGVTLAPANFGSFSNDLLIGNFGNGEILAYDATTDLFLGTLNGANGQPLDNPFLWALETRTGGANDNTNALYFTAGINNQQDGLFGEITATTPEPATIFGTATGLLAIALSRVRRRNRQAVNA